MAVSAPANSTIVNSSSMSLINTAAYHTSKLTLQGFHVRKVEVVFTAMPYFQEGNKLVCKHKYTETVWHKSLEEEGMSPRALFNFAERIRDSYQRIIEGFRENHELLNLKYQINLTGEKLISATEGVGRSYSIDREIEGYLNAPFWDRLIGELPSPNLANALTDFPFNEEPRNSEHSLRVRALLL